MHNAGSPLVSVVLAVRDGGLYLRAAVESVLRQTLADLELVVVDDASTDETPDLLSAISDPRLVVLANDEQLGLAGSLNRGLERARGPYVARLDADDVAFPDWLESLLARIHREPRAAVVGTAMLDVDASGNPGRLHRLPRGATAVRWHALFGSPFFHSTVLVERSALEGHGLRYDPSYHESEDYDLWARLLAVADGDNLPEPLVLHRVHPSQASQKRRALQESHRREVALREIARVAPDLGPERAELAWRFGTGRVGGESAGDAARAYLVLLERFEWLHGIDRSVRVAAARTVARSALGSSGATRARLVVRALEVAPSLPARQALRRARRSLETRRAQARATAWLRELVATEEPAAVSLRVTVVSPEPTPYRSPLFDRIALRPELDLTVLYAGRTVAGRTWSVEPKHPSVFLRGAGLPGARRLLRHDYPVTPGIGSALRATKPDVVVVSGWSTFASQAAIAWCRVRRIPYVLLVESHDLGPRAGWRRAVKGTVVPQVVRGAAGALAVGSLARRSLVERGAPAQSVRIFANTVDVPAWEERAARLAPRRDELRSSLGAGADDVVVLSVGRLAPEKGLDTAVRAIAEAADPRLVLAVAGSGPAEATLRGLADDLRVRLVLLGDRPEARLAEVYAAADVFALLSRHEPWGVVVNEAAASGLPLVLSALVGAAADLLRDGENGMLVPADDVPAAAAALRRLAADAGYRRVAGERSRELVRGWGYEPSVESFVAAAREAAAR